MATVGGGAAYKQLERLPDDLGRAMEGIRSDQRGEQRAAEAQIAAKQKRNDEFKSTLEIDPAEFAAKATGWQDQDEILFAASKDAMEQSINMNTEAAKLWNAGKEDEARAMRDQALRIQNSFKNFASQREEFAAIVTVNREKMQQGKILTKSWGQFQDAMDRHEYTVDYKDGDFIITALVRDANGDIEYNDNGTEKYIQKSMNDIRKGLDMPFEIEDAYGENGMIDNMMINFGVKKFDKESDGYIVTTQTWDNTHDISLNNYISGVIGDEKNPANNREMYKWYVNATGEEKFGNWTDEDRKIVENYIRSGVASQFPESESRKIRGLRPDEKIKEADKDRGLRKSLSDDAIASREAEGARNRAAQMERLKLQLDAKAKAAENKDKVKAMGKNAEQKMAAVGLYELSKKIAELDPNADESDVQKIIDESEYGFMLEGDSDGFLWLGDTEYEISGGLSDVKIKDVFRNFKGFVKAAGLEVEDTDLKDIMANPSKYKVEDANTTNTKATDSDPLGLGI